MGTSMVIIMAMPGTEKMKSEKVKMQNVVL